MLIKSVFYVEMDIYIAINDNNKVKMVPILRMPLF
ncbi:hypothetical protein DFP90_101474 [Aestuariispira insulae]|uniref:Uncharacterized protein n=1 Tax=Aestuariispira insulae TaxID=1461337 RepID=A0A3D9HW10_9PROT|nr:hypothetical protein DFP90_101474 [Aestuariispira insulae]